jgi:4-hydroxy-tetrahydrodipicolinate synthase
MRGASARFGHVITAMVTPFTPDGAVDYNRAAEFASWLLANGSDALVVNGTTGESPTTTLEEKVTLVSTLVQAVGKERIIAGAGGNNTAEVVELAKQSEEAGAGGILSVAPYYNKPSQEGLYRHFRTIAEAVSLPVILYNVPGRTITNVEPATTKRLVRDVPNIVGTKEASANMAQVAEIVRITPEEFDIYSGDDGTLLPNLVVGGAGVISVVSHLCGKDIAAVHNAWFAGDADGALRKFLPILPLVRAIFSAPSPSPLKWALERIGQPVGGVRLPLVELSDSEQVVVETALREYGLIS